MKRGMPGTSKYCTPTCPVCAAAAMLARYEASLKIDGIAVAVHGRLAEHGHRAVRLVPAQHAVVRDVGPDEVAAGADHVVGWTVLKPGASHERHLHRNCDEFFIVLKGKGHIIDRKSVV
mgnify:CR=1 FL=1